jgi:hypothetical protein
VGYGSGGARSLHFTALQLDGTRFTLHGPTAGRASLEPVADLPELPTWDQPAGLDIDLVKHSTR